LNIVCFRYRPASLETDELALNTLNRELLARLQESGVALPSSTMLGSRFAIRVAHVNHRTRDEDIAILVDTVLDIGRHLHRPAS
jgi:glutamate/tyrosine decarboxylase-like PLP-dependent enzyme